METLLDPKVLPEEAVELESSLKAKIIGQERALKQIVKAYVPMTMNMNREDRPLGNFLFLGPTGVGKTETVRVFAKRLLGSRDSFTRIDCVEFDASHEVAKLLGSPPGYVGYNDKPRLSQDNIDKYQTKDAKFNIILFDEIEKADPKLFDAIMTILGDGRLTLGNGNTVDFSKSFIFLTSNLGSRDIKNLMDGSGLGFKTATPDRQDLDQKIYEKSKAAVERHFRTEFINRIDSLVVFRSLSRDSLRKILKIEVEALQWRIWHSPMRGFKIGSGEAMPAPRAVAFKLTEAASNFLLDEGTSDKYGARELNRAIDKYLGYPLSCLIASKQAQSGDKLRVDYKDGKDLLFYLEDKPMFLS